MKNEALKSLFGGKARAESAARVTEILVKNAEHIRQGGGYSPEVIASILDAVKPPKALAGCVGGQKREQTVLTPEWLWRQLGPIALDPCTTPENPTQADEFCALELGCNGLEESWECESGLVYVNEPFEDLGKWLDKAALEAAKGVRILMLAPFRAQREWFTPDEVAALRPFKFVGHTSAFPAALCMIAWNCRVPELIQTMANGSTRSLVTNRYKRMS